MPFDVAKTPLLQWALTAATIITDSISAGPTGPNNPVATSRPLATSAPEASAAKNRPGRKPSVSKYPDTAARPYPPNQPNSFWAPCAAIRTPNTSRATSNPSFIRSPLNVQYYTKYSNYM